MMDSSFPAFDQALAQLHHFLDHHQVGRPSVRWIFREDLALQGRSLLASSLLPLERTSLVAEKYSRAVLGAPPGVVLSAEGIDDDAVYCTIFVPVSEDDAEGRLVRGLKLSLLDALLPVVIVDHPVWTRAATAQTPAQLAYLDDRFQLSRAPS